MSAVNPPYELNVITMEKENKEKLKIKIGLAIGGTMVMVVAIWAIQFNLVMKKLEPIDRANEISEQVQDVREEWSDAFGKLPAAIDQSKTALEQVEKAQEVQNDAIKELGEKLKTGSQ